jgi:poly(A) polymerase
LYRLHQANYVAYLVGGSVRDLLLGRRPKDFDVGTDAHPYQIKKLFRNCWIVGRRFRLAHVKFGPKTIEVATFRRGVVPGTESEPPLPHGPATEHATSSLDGAASSAASDVTDRDHLIHRDNTFGTPEEDAFRRDFTINALIYDIATCSIIDYVGGLEDLRGGLIRSIGDPDVRFREDPVRMLRAIVLGARLGFEIDPPTYNAVVRHRADIARSAPARLVEEYYKVLRSGASARAFCELGRSGLLKYMTPEIASPLPARLLAALEALDGYRNRFDAAPDVLTNPILIGSLLVPLGRLHPRHRARGTDDPQGSRPPASTLGMLTLSRRDTERLVHLLAVQRRLLDLDVSFRAKVALMRRNIFRDALTWLEIHGNAPEAVAHWRELLDEASRDGHEGFGPDVHGPRPRRRRRRRRRSVGGER